jgi:hypothetical protein
MTRNVQSNKNRKEFKTFLQRLVAKKFASLRVKNASWNVLQKRRSDLLPLYRLIYFVNGQLKRVFSVQCMTVGAGIRIN